MNDHTGTIIDLAVMPTYSADAGPRVATLCAQLEPFVATTVVIANSKPVLDDLVERQLPANVEVLSEQCNLGFGGAINTGLAVRPHASSVLIINDDVEFDTDPGTELRRLTSRLSTDAELAGLSLVPDSSGTLVPWPTALGVVLRVAGLWGVGRRVAETRRGRRQLEFFCVLANARMIRAIGGFDEVNFPLYFEDADLAARLHRSGQRFEAVDFALTHAGSLTSRLRPETTALQTVGAHRHLCRNLGWAPRRASAVLRASHVAGIVASLMRGRPAEVPLRWDLARCSLVGRTAELPPFQQ